MVRGEYWLFLGGESVKYFFGARRHGWNIDNFVDIDTARKHIEETSIALARFCALPNPRNTYENNEIEGLSCVDKSRLDYFYKRIAPNLHSKMHNYYSGVIEIGNDFNEDSAKKIIATNPILKALETLDASIDTADAVIRGDVHEAMGKAAETSAKAVQTFVNTSTIFKGSSSSVDSAIAFNKNSEMTSSILQTLFNVPACLSIIKTGKGSSEACGNGIISAFKSVQLDLDLKKVDNKKLESNIQTLIDSLSIIHKTLKIAKANNLKDVKRALFGLTDSFLNMSKNAILAAYRNTNNREVTAQWEPAYISTRVIDKILQPLARIGKECVAVDRKEEPLQYTKCISRQTQEIGALALETSIAIVGNVLTINKIEDMNAQIVASRVLEEFLFVGSNNHQKVYKKYNVPYGGSDFQHYLQFGALIKAIGKKEYGFNGVAGYEPWTTSAWTALVKRNPFSIEDVRSIVSSSYTQIVQESSVDFESPAIDMSISKINQAGTRRVELKIDSLKNYNVKNTKLVCYSDEDSDYPITSPWSGNFTDTNSFFEDKNMYSFDVNFTSSGYRGFSCNLYKNSGPYLGSKSKTFGVLNLDISNTTTYKDKPLALDIKIIDKWTNQERKDIKITRYMYRDAQNSDIKYCDESQASKCEIRGLDVGIHKVFVLIETENGITETDIVNVTVLSADTDSDNDGMPDVYELRYAPDLNMSKDDASEDADGDGVSNYQEYIDKTDPTSLLDYLLLSTPTKLRAIATDTNITLEWNSVEDAIAYSICQAEESISENMECTELKGGQLIGVSSNESLIYNDTSSENNFFDSEVYHQKVLTSNLKKNTVYYFRIKALDRKGHKSNLSNEATSKLQDVVVSTLAKPTNVTATPTIEAITLNWDKVENASIYKICISTSSISDGSKCEENGGTLLSGGTSRTKTITDNLNADTTYYFRVRGVKEGYLAEWSDEVSSKLQDVVVSTLAKPTNVTATPTIEAITLNWDKVENASIYKICMSRIRGLTLNR